MENRILIIGDELFGDSGEVAFRASEMLLCEEPNRPMQFSINAPLHLSILQLQGRAASDIIGKKAGRIVLGLGIGDIKKGISSVEKHYSALIDELVKKTQSVIHLVTIPKDLLIDRSQLIERLNQTMRDIANFNSERITVFDWEKHVLNFQEKQEERGKFGRSLFSETSKPTSLCITFLSMFLEDCILKELKNKKEFL